MLNKFHEEDYDGVVLKIPSWFIAMNDLDKDFAAFETALKTANKSMFFPDHQKNLYELENIQLKAKMVKEKKEKAAADEKSINDRNRKIYSGEMFQLEWVDRKSVLGQHMYIGGTLYEYEDMFTKTTLKAEFVKKLQASYTDYESLKLLSQKNQIAALLGMDLAHSTADLFDSDFYFFRSGGWEIGIAYRRLCVRTDWQEGRKRGWLFINRPLVVLPDGSYGINRFNNAEPEKLVGFERQGMYLVKKKTQNL